MAKGSESARQMRQTALIVVIILGASSVYYAREARMYRNQLDACRGGGTTPIDKARAEAGIPQGRGQGSRNVR